MSFCFFLIPYSRDILNRCSDGRTPVLVLMVMWIGNAFSAAGLRICCWSWILWCSLHGFSIVKGSYTLCIEWDGRLSLIGFPSVKPTLPFLGECPPPPPAVCVLCTHYAGFLLWSFSCSSCSCQVLGQACSSFLRSLGGGSGGGPSEIFKLLVGSFDFWKFDKKLPLAPPIKPIFFADSELTAEFPYCWYNYWWFLLESFL